MSVSGESVRIPGSPRKMVLVVFGSVAFVLAGLWLAGAFGSPPTSPRYGPGAAFVAGTLAIAFFGLCAVIASVALVRQLRGGGGLVFDADGFTDRSSVVAAGRVAWSEVSGLHVWSYGRTRTLCVDVHDAGAVLARQKQPRRTLMERNIRLVGTPVTISPVNLAGDFEELCRTFERFSGLQVTA